MSKDKQQPTIEEPPVIFHIICSTDDLETKEEKPNVFIRAIKAIAKYCCFTCR